MSNQTGTAPTVGSSELLACVECGQRPEVAEEELSEGMEATIQCQHVCNTVVGPTRWAVMEWNRLMGKQANVESPATRRPNA